MKYTRQSIGREAALALVDKKWWEGKSARDIAEFQMLTEELCMPFADFHEAITEAIGRPIFTHEFGLNWDGIASELFDGAPAPSFDEILELIPADKRLVIVTSDATE